MKIRELAERLSRKQLIAIMAIAVGILASLFLLSGPDKPPSPPGSKKPEVEVNLLGDADLEKEHWRATAERELERINKQQQELAGELKNLAEQMKEREERKSKSRLGQTTPEGFPPMPPIPPVNLKPPGEMLKAPPTAPVQPPQDPIRVFGPEAKILAGEGESTKAKPDDAGKKRPYLPSGSFIPGTLLSGLDAPAGVNSSKEPHPVLIKLTDLAVLPNRFRFDIRDCFIVGEGYGDLSSERAFVRTTTLSCVKEDESSVDLPLKGFVAGEDGKVGLRGRVVSKQGQFLARALVAGFAEGLSDVFSLSASTVSISPLGTTRSFDPNEALKAGAFSGVGKAMERLAQHYIEMAQQVFPVIEIDAGRKVDVVVLQGKPIESTEGNQ
jgi:conjugal transfer pilus assembly protein TraB